MERVVPEAFTVEADRQRYAERVAVFQRNGAFNAGNVGRDAYVLIVGRKVALYAFENIDVAAAEGHLRLVVGDELIACARAADRI